MPRLKEKDMRRLAPVSLLATWLVGLLIWWIAVGAGRSPIGLSQVCLCSCGSTCPGPAGWLAGAPPAPPQAAGKAARAFSVDELIVA
jgi:hypothetical protein